MAAAVRGVRDRVGPIARGHAFQGPRVEGREGRRAADRHDGACHVVGDETSIPVLARPRT